MAAWSGAAAYIVLLIFNIVVCSLSITHLENLYSHASKCGSTKLRRGEGKYILCMILLLYWCCWWFHFPTVYQIGHWSPATAGWTHPSGPGARTSYFKKTVILIFKFNMVFRISEYFGGTTSPSWKRGGWFEEKCALPCFGWPTCWLLVLYSAPHWPRSHSLALNIWLPTVFP